jgi:hypothetical protein
MNPLRRLLFGTGRFPDGLRAELAAEGIVLLEEGLRGSITLRHYRAPGKRSSWQRSGLYGAIAVTGKRVVVWGNRAKRADAPRDQPGMRASAEAPDRFLLTFDASQLGPDRSGTVEIRLRTPDAQRVAASI